MTSAFAKLSRGIRSGSFRDDDADDALQDAFCRLWCRRDNIPNESQAENLLRVTSRNIRIDSFRRQKSHPVDSIDASLNICIESSEEDESTEYVIARIDQILINSFSSRDREIFLLRDKDGWEFEDLAERFSLSEANIRLIVSRIRKKIREIYKNKYEI